MRRRWHWIVIGLLVAINAFLLYSIVDQAVTIDHHGQQLRHQESQIRALQAATIAFARAPLPIAEAAEALERSESLGFIKMADGQVIEVGGITLHFEGDKLIQVRAW